VLEDQTGIFKKLERNLKNFTKRILFTFLTNKVTITSEKLLIALVRARAESRAEDVFHAVKGLGTDEHALIDVIIHNTDKELEASKQFFRQKYERSMDEYVKADTSFNFEKLLVHCLSAKRSEAVQAELIESDAEILYKAGEGKFGTDDKTFVEVFSSRSFEHLVHVNKRYTEQRGHDLQHAIKSETSGWYKIALLACVTPPIEYWAERCHQAIAGLGTDDRLLVRCFSENSKPFLHEVAKVYERMYKVTLLDDVNGDVSGHYREIIDALLDLPENERVTY